MKPFIVTRSKAAVNMQIRYDLVTLTDQLMSQVTFKMVKRMHFL